MKELTKLSSVEFHPNPSLMQLPRGIDQVPIKKQDVASMVTMAKRDRQLIGGITFCIIMQCVLVFLASGSVLRCMWSPDKFSNQYVKVVLVMYLYDYKVCGYGVQSAKGIQNIKLGKALKETKELNIKLLQWSPLIKSTSTRLTQNTRLYLELSIGFHSIWMAIAIVAWIFCHVNILNFKYLKLLIGIFMYASIIMVVFDVSMGIVYLAHIQQSLTISMVLRYAGWAVELKVDKPEKFAGWIPMLASVVWMRGIVFLIVNVLFIKTIRGIRKKIKKKEVIKKHTNKSNSPIPDSMFGLHDEKSLVIHA